MKAMRFRSGSCLMLVLLVVLACERRDRAAEEMSSDDTLEEARTIQVVLGEWSIELEADTVQAGRVRFVARNEGQVEHALEVERGEDEWETEPIPAGDSATLDVDLQPGTYEVYCPVEDQHGRHDALGMRTRLVVR